VQSIRKISLAAWTIVFIPFFFLESALEDFSRTVDGQEIIQLKRPQSTPKTYSQNPEEESWEQLKGKNLQSVLIDWQLLTNPGASDKYMDKRIIGMVKNNSVREFSELKIEFTVYDEEGAQIAIVFSNFTNLKPGSIWKFEIPVTSDVGKAELKGLYIPARKLKEPE
jgi:hypothetical protein